MHFVVLQREKVGGACSHHNTQGGDLWRPRHTAQTGLHASICAVWTRAYLQLGPGEYESLLADLRPWHDNAMSITDEFMKSVGMRIGEPGSAFSIACLMDMTVTLPAHEMLLRIFQCCWQKQTVRRIFKNLTREGMAVTCLVDTASL